MSDLFVVSDAISFQTTPEGAVLLQVQSGEMFTCNSMATRILKVLEQGKTLQALCQEFSENYDGPSDTIRSDIEELLQSYLSFGIVEKRAT